MIRLSAGVVVLLSSVAAAEVVNGSFESAALNQPGRAPIASLTDWNASGGFSLLERGVNSISNIEAHSDDQFVSVGHSGTSNDRLTQTIDTVAGVQYTLEYWLRSIQGSQFQVVRGSAFDAGTSEVLGSVDGSVEDAGDGWVRHSVDFTATSGRTQIELLHTVAGSAGNVAIDTVSVTVIPASAALLVVPIGLAGLARRKR